MVTAESDELPLPGGSRIDQLRQYRFALLLGTLTLLFLSPVLISLFVPDVQPLASRFIVSVTFTWLMIASVFAISNSRPSLILLSALAIPATAAQIVDTSLLRTETLLLSHSAEILFLSYVIVIILKFVFRSHHVNSNTICAALCVYLLLGIVWAYLYSLVEVLQPGSFSSIASEETTFRFGSVTTSITLYFSYVTITTLGYGDIVPTSLPARTLATLQAIAGQFYLAVLVARLVGLHIVHSQQSEKH